MRLILAGILGASIAALSVTPAVAQTREYHTLQVEADPPTGRGTLIDFYGPVGQSFVANAETLTSFGFQFQTFNAGLPNTPITFSLLSGAGLGGPTLYSQSLTLPDDLPQRDDVYTDFAVPDLAVTVGQSYTAVFSAMSNRIGLALGPGYTGGANGVLTSGDAYVGGRAYSSRSLSYANCAGAGSNCDFNFLVTGFNTIPAVPEPASWALMICGFAMIGATIRRRRARSGGLSSARS